MESSIIRINHGDELFKETIAMSSLNKQIRKELGYPLSSDKYQIWWVYMSKELLGFCSMIIAKNEIHLCHDYILPKYRGSGLYDKLFNNRLNYAKSLNLPITAVATSMSLGTYLRYGFKIEKQSKNYSWVRKEAENE